MEDTKQDLLTIREVAKVLRLSKSTIKTYIQEGKIKSIKLGYKTVRITQETLDEFIKIHTDSSIS